MQVSQILEGTAQARLNELKGQMVAKEAAAAELQKSLERALEEKLKFQEEIDKIAALGDAAGVKQVQLCFSPLFLTSLSASSSHR